MLSEAAPQLVDFPIALGLRGGFRVSPDSDVVVPSRVLTISEQLVGSVSFAAHQTLHLAGKRQELRFLPWRNLERDHRHDRLISHSSLYPRDDAINIEKNVPRTRLPFRAFVVIQRLRQNASRDVCDARTRHLATQ